MSESPVQRDAIEAGARRFVADFVRTTRVAFARPSYVGIYAGKDDAVKVTTFLARRAPVVEAIREGELDGRHAASRGVKVSLPRRLFLVKEIALPGSNPVELKGMIEFELANAFPLSPDEIVWDWRPVKVREDGYTVCRVVAMETAVLAEQLETLGLGEALRVAVEPSTTSLANYYLATRGAWPQQPVVLVAAATGGVDMAVVGPDGIVSDRGFMAGGLGASIEELAAEIGILVSLCGASWVNATPICLVGDMQSEFARGLEAASLMPVEVLETPQFMPAAAEGSFADRAIAVGASLGPMLGEGIHLDLQSADLAEKDRRNSRAYVVSASVLMGVLIFAFSWLALAAQTHRTARFIERLEARAAEIRPIAGDVDAKRQRLSAIQNQLSGQSRVLDLLVALYRVTPPDVTLTSLEMNAQGVLTIKGQVQQLFRASEYALLLDKDPTFGTSAQQGPRAYLRNDSGKTFIAFTIVRELKIKKGK